MSYCIPPDIIEKVKGIVTSNDSINRDAKLTELLGSSDAAKQLNTAYEKSLLLSNQKTAIDRFINGFTELGQQQKADLSKAIQERLANRTEAIHKDELLSIAQDIWNKKYTLDIPLETVKKMNDLKLEADSLKVKMEGTPVNSPERMAYGEKIVDMSNIVNDLKNPTENMGFTGTLKAIGKETASRFSKDQGVFGNVVEGARVVKDIATSAVYKSVQASMDMSYAFRQGYKVLTTNPTLWKDSFIEAFKPFQKITSKEDQSIIADAFKARLVSNPLYQQAMDSKLAIGVIEDWFPTTLAEKIPVLGNIFKASNEAFTIFSQGARMGLYEDMVNQATKAGTEITPQLTKDIAKLANSVTGRGSLGKLEANSSTINKIFYSGRYIKSSLDTFIMPFDTKLSPMVQKEAQKVAIKNFATIGSLMAAASLFTDVESDPRSTKFGKMKVPGSKDTWIDLTGGLGSYIALASRLATQKSKSATTNKITELNTGKFGSPTEFDVVSNWLTGKLSPAPATAVSYLKGKDFSGKKPTIGSSALNLATPIAAGNAVQIFQDENAVSALMGTIADMLGASQTSYSRFKK